MKRSKEDVHTTTFMDLPMESRSKIVGELIGHRMLHVVVTRTSFSRNSRTSEYHTNGSPYVATAHTCTIARTCTPTASKVKFGCYRATLCDEFSLDKAEIDEDKMRIFRVSRQLYVEASHVFWTTNAFAFGEHSSFLDFRSHINPDAVKKIRMLHLNFRAWSASPLLDFERRYSCLDNLMALPSLRKLYLHICLERAIEEKLWARQTGVHYLHLLHLDEVSVEIDDNYPQRYGSLPAPSFSYHERREWCERLREHLLGKGVISEKSKELMIDGNSRWTK